jgi:hypothetical protein
MHTYGHDVLRAQTTSCAADTADAAGEGPARHVLRHHAEHCHMQLHRE